MESGAVVEGFDVVEDGAARLGEGGEALMIDDFIFEAAPKGLDEGVIVAVAFSTHRSDEAMLGQHLSVSSAGELHAAIGVEKKSGFRTSLKQRHAQGGNDETGIKDLVHGPPNDAPSIDIQDRDEIEPALAGEDAGGIGDPSLIGPVDSEGWEPVRCDRSAMVAVGRLRPVLGALPGEDPFRAHEPGNAIAPTGATQSLSQSRTAIGLAAAGKLLSNALAQMDVLELARAGLTTPLHPVVITAARNQERFAQPCYLIGAAHLFDSGIPLGGTSERMPRDFFNTSRCSKSLLFSARKRRISASSSSTLRRRFEPGDELAPGRSVRAQR